MTTPAPESPVPRRRGPKPGTGGRTPGTKKPDARILLPSSRVAPETKAALDALAAQYGGLGRALDALVAMQKTAP